VWIAGVFISFAAVSERENVSSSSRGVLIILSLYGHHNSMAIGPGTEIIILFLFFSLINYIHTNFTPEIQV
jgi:hypothetical protein